jgi:hypothetical protein
MEVAKMLVFITIRVSLSFVAREVSEIRSFVPEQGLVDLRLIVWLATGFEQAISAVDHLLLFVLAR